MVHFDTRTENFTFTSVTKTIRKEKKLPISSCALEKKKVSLRLIMRSYSLCLLQENFLSEASRTFSIPHALSALDHFPLLQDVHRMAESPGNLIVALFVNTVAFECRRAVGSQLSFPRRRQAFPLVNNR